MRIFFYLLDCILDVLGTCVGLGLEGSFKDGIIGLIVLGVILLSWYKVYAKLDNRTNYKLWTNYILAALIIFFIIAVIFGALVLIEWIF